MKHFLAFVLSLFIVGAINAQGPQYPPGTNVWYGPMAFPSIAPTNTNCASIDSTGMLNTKSCSTGNLLDASAYTGSDASVKINACILTAIANGGGICDARSFSGVQTMTQAITVGNASSVSVTLLLPASGNWIWSVPVSTCAITLLNRSAIIGYSDSGEGIGFTFEAGNGFSGESLFCTQGLTGDGDTASDSYFRAENFTVRIDVGATVTDSAALFRNAADSSIFKAIEAVPDGANAPIGVHAIYDCCGTSFQSVGADSFGSTATTIPCKYTASVTVIGGSCVHATTGQPDLLVDNTTGDDSPVFIGMYFEYFGTVTYPHIEIKNGNGAVTTFINPHCLSNTGQYCLQVDATSSAVNVLSMHSTTSPAINDLVNNISVPIGGSIPFYSTSPNYISNNITYSNKKDATFGIALNSGSTVGQIAQLEFQDRGSVQWDIQKIASNNLEFKDPSGLFRLNFQPTADTDIRASGTGAINFNDSANSGSGGVKFWSGTATPALVASIDNSGLATFNNRVVTKHTYANGTPTIICGTGAGTSPTVCTITGSDDNGVINITTGSAPASSATIATITLANPCITLAVPETRSANANAASLTGNTHDYVNTINTNSWKMISNATGLTASTAYSWTYHNGCY